MEAARDPASTDENDRETEPPPASTPTPRTVSDDLPLTLFVTALTAVGMSAVNAAPELIW